MNRDELLTKLAMELEEWPCKEGLIQVIGDGFFPTAINGDSSFSKDKYLQRRTELINRPSWNDAPEWAKWLAQDSSGEFCWHQNKPWTLHGKQWDNSGKVKHANYGWIPAGHNWRDTLEPRPQAQSDIKTCRHCDIEFRRPHVDGIPDDRCTRCDDEIKALWPEPEPAKSWWTSKTCTECGHATAAKVSDDEPVCPGCVALSYDEDSDAGSALSRALDEQQRGSAQARSKYHREIKPGVWVDVYDVLRAWGVKNPALQHLIKKALAPGERGHKTLEQDMNDIVASAKRAKELEE